MVNNTLVNYQFKDFESYFNNEYKTNDQGRRQKIAEA
jgi:hypothetical protein